MKAGGRPLEIITLPMPGRIVREDQRLPASYANFYIANKGVLLPTFADSNDEIALSILQKLFPDRSVIGIDSRELIWGLGAFHCLTQQQPAIL
jgi:agmatine deiminase